MPTGPNEFPRGKDLPSQTPSFWVEQKSRYLRQLLISDIEEMTGRALVVMIHGRHHPAAYMHGDDPPALDEAIDRTEGPFDLLLDTPGGLVDSAEKICSSLRQRKRDYRVVVPGRAKSGGTAIALSAASIVMGPGSELGPIDPSLGDLPAEFLKNMFKGDPTNVIQSGGGNPEMALRMQELVWSAEQASAQIEALAKKMLRSGMKKSVSGGPSTDNEIDRIVTDLATRTRYSSHGATVDAEEAKALGLIVHECDSTDEIWRRFVLLWHMYRHDMTVASRPIHKIFETATSSLGIVYPAPPPV